MRYAAKYNNLVGNNVEKTALGRSKCRWEENIKDNIKNLKR
jgi:hypothetical protein